MKIKRLSAFDIMIFFRQFSTLLSAGIPLLQTMEFLIASPLKPVLIPLFRTIQQDLLAGKELHLCLKAHPQYFSLLTCHLIQLGEFTGKLDTMLSLIAAELEKQYLFKKEIKRALFYPAIVATTGLIITFCLVIFIIPKFADLFADLPVKLPLLTRAIFYVSQHFRLLISWPALLVLMGCYALLTYQSLTVNQVLGYTLNKLPYTRNMLQKLTLMRFMRNLAITYAAGVPITEGLNLAGQASGNREFIRLIQKVCALVSTGLPLHQAFSQYPYFPPLLIYMIKTGEETGTLEAMLLKLTALFEADIEHVSQQASRLLEPLIMIILGVLIGGLVIGMYLPIFKLGSII